MLHDTTNNHNRLGNVHISVQQTERISPRDKHLLNTTAQCD